jgi:hypothetical protein
MGVHHAAGGQHLFTGLRPERVAPLERLRCPAAQQIGAAGLPDKSRVDFHKPVVQRLALDPVQHLEPAVALLHRGDHGGMIGQLLCVVHGRLVCSQNHGHAKHLPLMHQGVQAASGKSPESGVFGQPAEPRPGHRQMEIDCKLPARAAPH